MKYFFLSLPITSLWPIYFIAYSILPAQPMTYWWDIPLAMTFFIVYVAVSAYGLICAAECE